MSLRACLGVVLLTLVSGCVSLPADLPDTGFAPGAVTQRVISSYYAQHASEDYGRCNWPYFDAITKVDVVQDAADRLVLDVRYAYLDRLQDDVSSFNDDDGFDRSRKVCTGFESRQFTLTKAGGGLQVIDMTGPVRGGSGPGNVTLGGQVRVGVGGRMD